MGLVEKMGERIHLPEAFEKRMRLLLGKEYEDFRNSYDQDRYYGLRYNPLKTTEKEFLDRVPFTIQKIDWAREGYYYKPEEQPGKHVLHELGAYYIQEPSAMAVVELLDPQPGENILDLCAAPGGKSTQIAGRMRGQGLLVSNEIVTNRAKILAQNIERLGVKNCVVCNETPARLAELFPAYFDRIVVDAPCSGEGMFRKDETAIREWSPEHVEMCAARQSDILQETADMLKPGGRLVYSTCTFAPEENEGVISSFLKEHPDFELEQVPHYEAFSPGRPEWIGEPAAHLERTMHLFPHKLHGEGHYIAVLRKTGSITPVFDNVGRGVGAESPVSSFLCGELGIRKEWVDEAQGALLHFGEQIYLVPERMISLKGVKVVRPGLHLATEKKNRLEPAHALALALQPQETDRKLALTAEEVKRYLRGESVGCGSEKGWILLTYLDYPVGFGKASAGQIKNHYPKGLRKTELYAEDDSIQR
jgi:NOL1/NOP2/sun family putative RNA methylase